MISIVVTAYNYGKYLKQAIDSVLSQTYTDIEIILIDDGSTDDTEIIAREYLRYSFFRYFRQSNKGQPKAKNQGISHARGDFIAFLDADDFWESNKLKKQNALFADSDVGVVYSRRNWVDSDGLEISGNERVLRRGKIIDHIFIDNFVCFSSSVIRKSYLEQIGYFDESLPMGIDYDLWIRLASVCKFDFVDEPLVNYRTGHSNLSKNTTKRYECAQQIMRKNLSNPQIVALMSWYVPGLAWSDTWSNYGYYLAINGNKKEGMVYVLKAIFKFPFYLNAYKRFVKLLLHR